MITIQMKATGIEITSSIKEYLERRLQGLEKFAKGVAKEATCYVEIGKDSNHHKKGEVFSTEISFISGDIREYVISHKDDLYKSIDDAKDELVRVLSSKKEKRFTLFKRGASSIKKMMKGITKRNPLTSKY